jgi:outer membrane protein assembly factor BamB
MLASALIGPAARADWLFYQHDAQHTGLSESNFDPTGLTKVWSAPVGYSTPLVVGDTVYALKNQQGIGGTGISTNVSSFNLTTGAVNWTYSGNFVFPSQEAYAQGKVAFIGQSFGGNSSLYVLDANSGQQLYTVALPSNFQGAASPMPLLTTNPNGQLTAYIEDGNHAAAVTLGASSGSVLW